MDDDDLLARVAAGDDTALRELFGRHAPWLAVRLRAVLPAADVEDVLQETFLEVVKSIGQYRGEGHLWGWVRQIASSKALMRLRAEKLRMTDQLVDEAAGAPPPSVAAGIDLERALEQLSTMSRAVVWLHDVEGFTHEEIAEQMGRTVSFSKSQLARAHARLRRLLSPAVAGS